MSVLVPAGQDIPSRSRPGRFSRVWASPILWVGLVAVGLAVPLLTRALGPSRPPLPVLGTLPAFSLVDESGRAFGRDELAGKVWVAGFIFTRCPTICPAITATMGRIQHRARGIAPNFRLVSFTVDPQYDTPARLAEYAKKHRASPRLWKFLGGPLGTVRDTITGGLKIAMGDIEGEQDFASIMHGTHFVLVDAQARIRGYYDSSDADVVDRVLQDAAMLINRGD